MNKFLFWPVLCFVMLSASLCKADFYIGTYDYKNKYSGLLDEWALLDYGIDENDVPFAVITANHRSGVGNNVYKYRRKLIDFLISEGLSREEASSFHRVDFYYEFTPDCEKYALAHARFYEKQHGEGDRSRLIYSIDKIKRVLRNT